MGIFSEKAELASYDGGSTVLGIICATTAWTVFYTALVLCNACQSHEWNCRVVSTLHALVVVFMTSWSGFVQGPWPFTEPGTENTKLQHWTCIVVLGYFIYDLIWCLYFQTEGAIMLFHHLLSLYGQLLVIFRGRNGTEMMATLWGSEMTNPLLQMRWFLRNANLHETWYAEVNDHLFMISFGLLRIGVGSILLYTTLSHARPDWIAKSGGVAIYIMSWAFWVMIVKYAFRKYRKVFASLQTRNISRSNGPGAASSITMNGTHSSSNGNALNGTSCKEHDKQE